MTNKGKKYKVSEKGHKARSEPHTRFTSLTGMLYDPQGCAKATSARKGARRPESMG